jgi:hypothetical protein
LIRAPAAAAKALASIGWRPPPGEWISPPRTLTLPALPMEIVA